MVKIGSMGVSVLEGIMFVIVRVLPDIRLARRMNMGVVFVRV